MRGLKEPRYIRKLQTEGSMSVFDVSDKYYVKSKKGIKR